MSRNQHFDAHRCILCGAGVSRLDVLRAMKGVDAEQTSLGDRATIKK